MKLSRRNFLGGAGVLGGMLAGTSPIAANAKAMPTRGVKTAGATKTTTICPFCAVGCGLVVSSRDGKVINIEGDPEHPINEGSLCSKGMALFQVAVNDSRLRKVQYRAPGSEQWEEKSWEWAFAEIAKRIQKTRDQTFVQTEGPRRVNRTEGIACLGGASLDNEECYLYSKLARAMGVVFLEHQARI
jgi:formate dehydrogenase major subunit